MYKNITLQLKPILLLGLWVGLLLLVRGPHQSLMAHDEGWYAQQARWIVENNDWITQHWWNELIYDRAMGLQWLIAASYHLFGISDGTARLPGAFATLAATWLTYAIGRRGMPAQTAFVGAAILAATPIWMQSARLATQDVPLTAIELLAIWALLKAEEATPQRRLQGRGLWRRWLWGLVAGAALGLGFMVKSFMVFLPAVALLPYLVLDHRRHRHLTNPGLYVGLLLGAIPPLLWLGLNVQRYGLLPINNFFGHLFNLSQQDFHGVGPFYYFWNIPANAFPWPLLAIPGIFMALRHHRYVRRWLWLGYPIGLFIELTLFKTRTWYYPLQLMPFIGLMAAVTLVTLARHYRRRWGIFTAALGAVLGLILLGAGIALLVRPGLWGLTPSWPYGLLGLGLGGSWLIPFGVYLRDRNQSFFRTENSSQLWIAGWLLGPWLAILTLYSTGLWGDYGNRIKLPLQSAPIAEVVQTHPIHFVLPDWEYSTTKDGVLLTWYTPQLGDLYTQPEAVPDDSYAWLQTESWAGLARPYQVISQADNWSLVYFRSEQAELR